MQPDEMFFRNNINLFILENYKKNFKINRILRIIANVVCCGLVIVNVYFVNIIGICISFAMQLWNCYSYKKLGNFDSKKCEEYLEATKFMESYMKAVYIDRGEITHLKLLEQESLKLQKKYKKEIIDKK
jgi:hypothetical protein